ncbi:NAD dependent epimerase/dehydratase family protein [Gonapodya prolifera JEL478]|uniref:NAD dependent epimerase/dehydratase family protein n=1 Tax=Gonapodya prolifera (strain JEL478) TaxID=1344416 RepID=A0A139A6B7_GONPJ|nr:NAD dependent epimerase/dehydratase family protein [Gonapodya prolifera JEL478]|eukprot:KXS12301.1 NAD dependent epimerase/dehydratase family protein [Gonapodya prolifera JEL478]
MPTLPDSDRLVVLVTGCSAGGIGHSLCTAFGRRGHVVYAAARDITKIGDVVDGVKKVQMDVTDGASVKRAVEEVLGEVGRVDILVNNAGINFVGAVLDTDIDEAKGMFDANVFGALRVCQAVAPHMIKRRKGTIVNVGSVVGEVAMPWAVLYASSKSALHALTDGLRMELTPFNIRVVCVKPGAITSNISSTALSHFRVPAGSFFKPWEEFMILRSKSSQIGATPTSVFAEDVVGKVLGGEKYEVWSGKNTWLFWVFKWFLPLRIAQYVGMRTFGLVGGRAPKLKNE